MILSKHRNIIFSSAQNVPVASHLTQNKSENPHNDIQVPNNLVPIISLTSIVFLSFTHLQPFCSLSSCVNIKHIYNGFHSGSESKNLTAMQRETRVWSLGKKGEGNSYLLRYSGLKNFLGREIM